MAEFKSAKDEDDGYKRPEIESRAGNRRKIKTRFVSVLTPGVISGTSQTRPGFLLKHGVLFPQHPLGLFPR